MLVLLLISLFSALVIPSVVSAMREDTVETQGEKVCDLLRFAHLSAISRHRAVDFRFNAERGLVWVSLSSPSLPWLEESAKAPQMLASLRLPEKLRCEITYSGATGQATDARQCIVFRSDGRAEDATVELEDEFGATYVIEIVAASGEVIVREAAP
jgi:Tfp pilus assembly protein FimT